MRSKRPLVKRKYGFHHNFLKNIGRYQLNLGLRARLHLSSLGHFFLVLPLLLLMLKLQPQKRDCFFVEMKKIICFLNAVSRLMQIS